MRQTFAAVLDVGLDLLVVVVQSVQKKKKGGGGAARRWLLDMKPRGMRNACSTWENLKRMFCDMFVLTGFLYLQDARLQQNLSPMASGGSPVDSYNSDSSANASPTETRQPSPAQPPFLSPPPPAGRGAPGAHSVVIPRKLSPGSASSSPRSGTDAESGKPVNTLRSRWIR